uniref:MPN domain-containing protein n=1 Tax=Chlamydomonas leiostraca TaxID=1034604 RepID=A0A7S0S117_9CHLO|mmetsp:Transcript_3975/g.9870  ORF Transcript_3975/g.9870 Transcript_3975/m.9870 type:complete len:423 (+) Transcript_3975:408-1676(+)|eukprot:CAMPEP_0202860738 /NCGR_PEP_ID=MMETSP1391-20130828/2349_1 /ASSEMBLY_ACC=CAM_ASM_000867 /TAXON_ID=1034604 /ORGANISM="Chlamydomonas leiostraca, Strain SAG 11-49" /LENGTH=422 /DNA_ID=CAMNT_0049539973 /DNA_START=399 /DNA_END=1667 /DNA_ORIENTATION=+
MLLRLRSRDGLERVEVADTATVTDLKQAINASLNIPLHELRLSKNPGLLNSKATGEFAELDAAPRAMLKSLGVAHGDMLFMLYSGERNVEPVVKKGVLDTRPFGARMTVADIEAKQVRVTRQEKADIEAVSFDRQAANVFQSYVQSALAFSIKRGGILYGSVGEDKVVKVEFIYEPPQEGSPTGLTLHRGSEEEAQVDFLAGLLGLKKVGWVFAQSVAERDFIMHTGELLQTAAIQDEIGEHCATVVVSWDAGEGQTGFNPASGQVHFEAFQCSRQCVQLAKDGWLQAGDPPSGVTAMRNPKEPDLKDPVIVASKDVGEVDNDYFLVPVNIRDHDGPLATSFPVENRLLPQGKAELREHLRRGGGASSRNYTDKLADLHLLLWLSKQPNLDTNDMTLLCDAVRNHHPVMEGYRVIIDSIAGL